MHGRVRVRVAAMLILATLITPMVASTGVLAASATRTPSPGCAAAASAGSTTLSLTVAGRARTVIVHVPRGYQPTVPTALVLNLHGTGSTAQAQEGFSGMNRTANADTFLVAYPQAAIPFSTGYAWNVPHEPLFGGAPVPPGSPNDVTFLAAVVVQLETNYCVNESEVYAAGFSDGARMASQLACDESGIFAAVAAVSGLRRPTPCPTTRPVSVIAFHGLLDQIDPYRGHGQAYWTYSVPTATSKWGHQDHCSVTTITTKSSHFSETTYPRCAGHATVRLYTIPGEGHEWPGGPTMPPALTSVLGPQTNVVNANDLMWSFFEAHPRA
ncbi:MAG TPA: PHB depolymerase family esterase [Acidimicrobiales bacterium]|nr:PHB depolymerase family esterase [Acidimicrobiales bacterium]